MIKGLRSEKEYYQKQIECLRKELEAIKLQPSVVQTPSMFEKESHSSSHDSRRVSSHHNRNNSSLSMASQITRTP